MFELKIKKKQFIFEDIDLENSISGAIEFHYTYDSYIELIWNNYPIRLSYSIIGDIYDGIVDMLELLEEGVEEFKIGWPCSAFFATWEFKVSRNNLVIKSHWGSISGGEKVEYELKNNVSDIICIDKNLYIKKWVNLLDSIKKDLAKIGYNFGNGTD